MTMRLNQTEDTQLYNHDRNMLNSVGDKLKILG